MAGIHVAMVLTFSLTDVKVTRSRPWSTLRPDGDAMPIGVVTFTKSTTAMVVGRAVNASRTVNCWRASGVMPAMRSIGRTPVVW